MGRKIPGRKHRGIRDPEKQQATRLAALSQKINSPPADDDHQAVPKSLLRVQELQRRMHNTKANSTKKRKEGRNLGIFNRRNGETDKKFLNRVHKQTEEVLKEAQFSDKYNVDIIRNRESGEVERVQKRSKDKLLEYLIKVKKDKGKNKKKTKKQLQRESEPKMTKSEKKRQKLWAKKQKHVDERTETNEQMNAIAFGEVCHGPPTLSLPLNRNRAQGNTKPGQRNLLLTSILCGNSSTDDGAALKGKSVDRKCRLRDLPILQRKKIESNQMAAINAYKAIKASKFK